MRTRDKVNSLRLADTLIRSIKGYALTLATKPTLSPAEERRLEQLRKLWPSLKTASTLLLLVCLTGCSSRGMELGGKLGLYEVDERTETSYMRPQAPRSLTCKLTGYGCPVTQPEMVRGS